MSHNRLTQMRRFTIPDGWQPGPVCLTFVLPFKGVAPMGPVEIQLGLSTWVQEQFSQTERQPRYSVPPVSAHWN